MKLHREEQGLKIKPMKSNSLELGHRNYPSIASYKRQKQEKKGEAEKYILYSLIVMPSKDLALIYMKSLG